MHTEIKKLEEELKNLVLRFKSELGTIRTSRPTPRLVEDIVVDYYNQRMTVKQLGSIVVIPPREMTVTVWDKAAVAPVAKAIEGAKIGLGVAIDGTILRLNLPPLTDERRADLVKVIKAMAEKERIKMRGLRDDSNKKIKSGETDEDMMFDLKEQVQRLVDKANQEIDGLVVAKVREISE